MSVCQLTSLALLPAASKATLNASDTFEIQGRELWSQWMGEVRWNCVRVHAGMACYVRRMKCSEVVVFDTPRRTWPGWPRDCRPRLGGTALPARSTPAVKEVSPEIRDKERGGVCVLVYKPLATNGVRSSDRHLH